MKQFYLIRAHYQLIPTMGSESSSLKSLEVGSNEPIACSPPISCDPNENSSPSELVMTIILEFTKMDWKMKPNMQLPEANGLKANRLAMTPLVDDTF